MSFSSDIRAWSKKTQDAATRIIRGSALEIFGAIVRRTPVRTGRLRGNWQCEINTIPDGEVNTTASQALSRVSKKTSLMKLTDRIYLVNNLPYAGVIENGSSTQAPNGMVKVTIAEWQRIVAQQAKR